MSIHPTAIVDAQAKLGEDVTIGAYSIIGPEVQIGAGSNVGPHVVIQGPTKIGKNNQFFQFSSIGDDPQDLKFSGEKTWLEIGDNNVFRECITLNRGTENGGGVTRLGNNNLLMAYVHIAHDCMIGDNNIFANNASLAGHVQIDNHVILGGFSLVRQFLHIGTYAFSAMSSVINHHIPPFVLVSGHMAKPIKINTEGLMRGGFSKDDIRSLRKSFKILYKANQKTDQAVAEIEKIVPQAESVTQLLDFIRSKQGDKSGIIR